MLYSMSVPSSVLAFVTTFHLALTVLRRHRTPSTGIFSFVTAISLLLAGSPWLMPSPVGLAVGVVSHLAWFIACERLLPLNTVAASAPRPSPPPAAVHAAPKPLIAAAAPAAPRAAAPRAPAPAAAPAAAGAPAARRPRDFVQVPVLAVFDETPDIRTFRMRAAGRLRVQGRPVPRRSALRADGQEHVRCYSISSPPDARGLPRNLGEAARPRVGRAARDACGRARCCAVKRAGRRVHLSRRGGPPARAHRAAASASRR